MKHVLFGALIIAFVGGILWLHGQARTAADFFAAALADAGIERISREPDSLRILYARTLAERTPLLALAGTDPNELKRAVDALERTQRALAERQTDNMRDAVASALYPIDFLRAAAELEARRIAFLASGSEADMDAYHEALEVAAQHYTDGVARFRDAFLEVVPQNAPDYVAGDSALGRDDVLSALDTLAVRAAELHDKIAKRERCLAGAVRSCDASELVLPEISIPDQEELEDDLVARALEILPIASEVRRVDENRAGPVVEMQKGSCTAPIEGAPLFAFFEETPSTYAGLTFFRPVYLGDMQLVDAAKHTNVPFYGYFAAREVRFIPDSPLTYYVCPEVGEESARILGIRAIAAFASSSRISSHAAGSIAEELQELEKRLSAERVSEHDALRYLASARTLIGTEAMPAHLESELVSLIVQTRNGSTHADRVISQIARTEDSNIAAAAHDLPVGLDGVTLFYVRNGMLVLFLTHNASFGSSPERLIASRIIPAEKRPYVYYSSLDSSAETKETIVRSFRYFSELHGF